MGCKQCDPDEKKTDLNKLKNQSNEKNEDARKLIELIEETNPEIKDDSTFNIPVE